MSGPYTARDLWPGCAEPYYPGAQILRCPDPENCTEMHMEHEEDEVPHHYGCECGACVHEYWLLKS